MFTRVDKSTLRFTEVYEEYYPVVFGAAYARTLDADEAHDICQEVFTRYYEKSAEVITPRTWLMGTLRLVVMEHFRMRQRTAGGMDEMVEDATESRRISFRDTRMLLEEAIEKIDCLGDGKDRTLFDLIAINNYTYKEAGIHLGMRERQARYRYGLVVSRLIRFLEERGIKDLEELL